MRAGVLKRVKEQKWDDVYPALMDYAKQKEDETRGVNIRLPEREKYHGVVQAAIEIAGLEVSTQGMRRRESEDPGFEYWLAKHGKTPEELVRDEQAVERGRVLDFRAVDLPDLVGESLKDEEKERAGMEQQGEDKIAGAVLEGMERLNKEMAEAIREQGELRLDILEGKKPEEQRQIARQYLNAIEDSNRDCFDRAIATHVLRLESSYNLMHAEVAEEVRARLAVHDSAELMKQAGGLIVRDARKTGPGFTVGSAATEATRRGHALDRETIDLFLRKGIEGLKIAEAWDLMQEANFDYIGFVEEVNRNLPAKDRLNDTDLELKAGDIGTGKIPTNYHTDDSLDRKDAVRRLIIEKLGGGGEVKKSLQLAEKLARASLETSIFNRTVASENDELGLIIGLRGWRRKRMEQEGRARGPRIHEEAIDGFGTSWLRRNRKGEDDVSKPLLAEDIDIEEIKRGSWDYFCTVTVTRYNELKGLILDRGPEPGSIDKTFLQTAIVHFNNADKGRNGDKVGPKGLRVLWLAGVVDMALADIKLNWVARDLGELEKVVTKETLTGKKGDTFITTEQWNWIKQQTDYGSRMRAMGFRRGLEGFAAKALPGSQRR